MTSVYFTFFFEFFYFFVFSLGASFENHFFKSYAVCLIDFDQTIAKFCPQATVVGPILKFAELGLLHQFANSLRYEVNCGLDDLDLKAL